jgi:hypothetical protein
MTVRAWRGATCSSACAILSRPHWSFIAAPMWTEFEVGAAYEGPAGHVHGGVCALVLDHVLGATAHQPGRPAVTGTLTIRYLRGTPLGPLRAEAHVSRSQGVKTFAVGQIYDAWSSDRRGGRCLHLPGGEVGPMFSSPVVMLRARTTVWLSYLRFFDIEGPR